MRCKLLDKSKYLTPAEIKLLFAKVQELEAKDKAEFRCYWIKISMMLNILFSCGLRVSELRNIRHQDIDLFDQYPSIHVIGKRHKARFIPLNPKLVKHIKAFIRYKTSIGQSVAPESYLFPSPRNPYLPYSIGALENLYLKCLSAAGLRRRSIHSARHSFGFAVYNSTRDLRACMQLMGHSSTQVSEIYTYCTFEKLHGYCNNLY